MYQNAKIHTLFESRKCSYPNKMQAHIFNKKTDMNHYFKCSGICHYHIQCHDFDFWSHTFEDTRRRGSKGAPHMSTKSLEQICVHTHLFLFMAGRGLVFLLYWGVQSVSAEGHLLHGGYFLCQARNHSKEPQVHQPICHSEVHHLQDLRQKEQNLGSDWDISKGMGWIAMTFYDPQMMSDDLGMPWPFPLAQTKG